MKTCIITLVLVCAALLSLAQTITQAEYFIDKDNGIGKNTKLNVTLNADGNFTFNVKLTNVTTGIHRLYIRTKDSNNKWSPTARTTIEVFSSLTYTDVVSSEYFFDTDPGVGKATVVAIGTADTAVSQTFTAKASGLSPGYHTLYIRSKDNDGRWGLNARRSVEIIKSLDTAKITSAEYFFSNETGFGKAITKAFAIQLANGTFNFTIPYNQIPAGADTLFVRMKDTDVKWSLTKLARFSGAPALTTTANNKLMMKELKKASLLPFNVAVSPNPVKGDVLTVSIQHVKQAVVQLALYSFDGKMVLSRQYEVAGNSNKQINLSTLTAGSYILSLSDGSEVRIVTIIKE